MKMQLWELKENIEEMIEKHGDNMTLERRIELKHPIYTGRVRVFIEGEDVDDHIYPEVE